MGVGHRFAGIITIDVAANEPPIAGDDVLTGEEDVILTFAVAVLTANDSDPDGDEVTFINVLETPQHGGLAAGSSAGAFRIPSPSPSSAPSPAPSPSPAPVPAPVPGPAPTVAADAPPAVVQLPNTGARPQAGWGASTGVWFAGLGLVRLLLLGATVGWRRGRV